VILSGGAPDGGLYVPVDDLPVITVGELQRLVPLGYWDRALRILEKLLHPNDVHPSLLRQYAQAAFSTGIISYLSGLNFCFFLLEKFLNRKTKTGTNAST